MSLYGSQKGLNSLSRRTTSRTDVTGGTYYARSDMQGGNGYGGDYAAPGGYNNYSFSKTSTGGGYGGSYQVSPVHQKASLLHAQCQEYLNKAELILQSGVDSGRVTMEVEKYMAMAKEVMNQLKGCALELRQTGQPNDNVIRSVEQFQDQLRGIHYALNGTTQRKKSTLNWEDPGRSFQEALGWIGQQKRLIETSSWGETSEVIDQQIANHSKIHSTIQRSPEVDKARDELIQKGDKANLHMLEQEWDSLQKASFSRTDQLRALQKIIEEISQEIMWVNEREEEELVFDWGDKNIDTYIPNKQESYSKLMSELEEKEKQLNKVKHKVDGLLKNDHPASDKIEAYMDTLQTQWSWLLQITKCIQVHLKENAAYSQFFKEANETYSKLQKEHENVCKKFTCDKTTPLETLQEMLKNLEKEKERIMENKRQVQHLVNKSKTIVKLKPRNPEEKSNSPIMVQALCDYIQDQKVIFKGNEGILKDNSERSNINLANKNEQYYEAILGIWNQLYINIKSLISWQYCLMDINCINSLTITMISKMRPEEYRSIIKSLETHYQEFQRHSKGSELFAEDDQQLIETQFTGAQTRYDDLVVQLPAYMTEEQLSKEPPKPEVQLTLLTELQDLRRRLEAAEDGLSQHLHLPLGEDGLLECSQRLLQLESIEQDVDSIRDDFLEQKEKILVHLDGITDTDKVKFLRLELSLINEKLGSLQGHSSSYTERMKKQMALLQALMQSEDVTRFRWASPAPSASWTCPSILSWLLELEKYMQELRQYRKTSTSLNTWIDTTRQRQSALQGGKFDDVRVLMEHINEHKALNSEIKGKREDVEDVLKDSSICATSIKDCELQLASYSSGLETLLNIPIKRAMLLSPANTITEEASDLQARYVGLLTSSNDYGKFLGEMVKFLEELKIRNTRIDLLEEELRLLREEMEEKNQKNLSLEELLAKYQLELSESKDQLLSMEEVKMSQAIECNTVRDKLSSSSSQLTELNDRLARLTQMLEEEQRKKQLLEETYKFHQEEYEVIIRKRQKELEEVNCAKIDIEKTVNDKEREIERLQMQLEDEASRKRELESELSKVRNEYSQEMSDLKTTYESEIHVTKMHIQKISKQKEDDSSNLKMQYEELVSEKRDLVDELMRLRLSMTEVEALRRKAEEEVRQQRSAGTEESNMRKELVVQIDTLIKERNEDGLQHKEALSGANRMVQEKNKEITTLTQKLEEEYRRKRALEAEISNLKQAQKDLQAKYASSVQAINELKVSSEEVTMVRVELEKQNSEKSKVEKSMAGFQSKINDLQKMLDVAKAEAEKYKKASQEEAGRRQRVESEMNSVKRSITEHTTTISLLKKKQEEASTTDRKSEQELRSLRESHDRSLREHKAATDKLAQLTAELKAMQEKLAGTNKMVQEKNKEITTLTQKLEEEYRRKRVLEAEIANLKQAQKDLQVKYASSVEVINDLKVSSEEVTMIRVELEKQNSERSKVDKSITDLQSKINDLQKMLEVAKAKAEKYKKASQEEAGRRQRVESEMNSVKRSITEHTTTISLLKKQQEEASTIDRKSEQELKSLRESHDKSLREHKATNGKLAQLTAELKALQQKLTQEQARVREANLRNETLYKTMEEKSKVLNSNATEIGKLQSLTQKQTKERLILEEELRTLRQELGDLKRTKESSSHETMAQISSLQLQLQNSSKSSLEYQRLMEELSKEREKLKVEIGKIQKQAMETSSKMKESQGHYDLILKERDSLLLKIKQMEQDKAKGAKNDEELKRVRVSLESELRLKQRLQEENNKIRKDFEHWKAQYELKEKLVRQYESEKGTWEKDRNSLKMEIERLLKELKLVEERYKIKLQSTEKEMQDLASLRDKLEAELRQVKKGPDECNKQTQTEMDMVDNSTLLFDGIRRKVTAHQLHDCGIIDQVTLTQLLKGQKTVEEVALDIQVYLKGTGCIAGMGVPEGRISFNEAKNKELLTTQSASKLLQAQAATGFIIDPKANEKMSVDVAVTRHLAMKKGWIDWETTLRLLQAQESVGGILDPVLSIFLTKDAALDRDLIDEELYSALNKKPRCYIDPITQDDASYIDLKVKCRTDPATGLLLLSAPQRPIMVKGLRREVSVNELVDSHLLETSDVEDLRAGRITSQDIEIRLRQYLQGSSCIAGVYDEANERILPIYQAMKEGLLRPGATLELLEAQAASGFMIDPVNNLYLVVEEAAKKGLVGKEYKEKLLSAERAVTGYKDPTSEKLMSLFEAIDIGLIEKGHGIRLLEAQIASGGIIDPKFSHRIDVDVAFQRGYFNKEMSNILSSEDDDTKGFFDPNTQENLTYLQLKNRCITDKDTGLILLQLHDKKKQQSTQKNTLRKRRVVIVDPDTNKEMTVKEAYDRELIDYETYLELSGQECEWEEITITAPDGSSHYVVIDRKTGIQYNIQDCLDKGLIDKVTFDKYRSKVLTLTQFMDIITSKVSPGQPLTSSTSTNTSLSSSTLHSAPTGSQHDSSTSTTTKRTSSIQSISTTQRTSTTEHTRTSKHISSAKHVGSVAPHDSVQHVSSTQQEPPLSPNSLKHIASISITLASPTEVLDEQSPVGAIFDSDNLEKITIMEALQRGIVDTITAQRLLEAQACTGGIIDLATGKRHSVQEAARQGIIDDDMATKLKPAQKAYLGFEDVKTKRKMSAVEAIKERWLPYGAGQRFLEFQYATGGLFDPEIGKRRSLQDIVQQGWLDSRGAQKLQDTRHHSKILTCPKTKLKISYKEAMDNCLVEEGSGLKMLHATTVSSKGISSPLQRILCPWVFQRLS
ncbi:hypothetical protein SKAU_G00074390 [Synaphobranchus kaupii]|uniref:Desmoplakin-like n=1 Tax=Synaphobranchus kaupii TaxID=118154 RepID=A0A9Q1J9U5_SYNKA|nr:hypothetical protein SKAU_G00074390 [Synaphobranchus kaupii]